MIIPSHHFINHNGDRVSCYWYEDRYRYSIKTEAGIEYRELGPDPDGLILTMPDTITLEAFLNYDTALKPYGIPQLSAKCIRCSAHHGAPRKEYNLASICNRCYKAMSTGGGNTDYLINEDGSKGAKYNE